MKRLRQAGVAILATLVIIIIVGTVLALGASMLAGAVLLAQHLWTAVLGA